MKHLTISDIYLEGNMLSEDARKTIYLTPTDALQYSNNTWLYHQCPTQVQWLTDIETQKEMHVAQGSDHLSFYFPENEYLNEAWFDLFKELGFKLGVLEFYLIEGHDLAQLNKRNDVTLVKVNKGTCKTILIFIINFLYHLVKNMRNKALRMLNKILILIEQHQ